LRGNPERTRNADYVDALISTWFSQHEADEAQRILDGASVPVSPIYSIADIFNDAQYSARTDIVAPADPELGEVPMPAVLPRFSRTPGAVRFVGPRLGEHNRQIYAGLLGLSETEQAQLHADGVI
jgi:formyl-CoA transferase